MTAKTAMSHPWAAWWYGPLAEIALIPTGKAEMESVAKSPTVPVVRPHIRLQSYGAPPEITARD
jgi:hypothetical protein